MISWILIFLSIFMLLLMVFKANKKYNNSKDTDDLFMMAFFTFIIIVIIACCITAYYRGSIIYPERYKTIITKILGVKSLISSEPLNMANIQMNRKLADLLIEKQNLLLKIRINNRNPFALFKIKLDKEWKKMDSKFIK